MKTWLVMFSCAVFANLLGLNISASFKRVVTIYILIPLLIIPQILLSGLVVRFDDIRSSSQGSNFVPWKGELMVSRWGFEVLAVEQFKSNRFHKHYYDTNKIISRCNHLQSHHIPEIKARIDFVAGKLDVPDYEKKARHNFALIQNEVHHMEEHSGIPCELELHDLTIGQFNRQHAKMVKEYLGKVAQHFMKIKQQAVSRQDKITSDLIQQLGKDGFRKYKKKYHNRSIENLVLAKDLFAEILETGDHLVQTCNPIYGFPHSHWGRAAFYAGEKQICDILVDTFIFDLAVIWVMVVILYIALYFNLIHKSVTVMERITSWRRR